MPSEISDWKLPLYKIYTDDEDIKIVSNVIKRGTNWALGPEIEELENKIKNLVGVDYCLVLNSGTSALHAILLSYGIGNGDEIIVPSFSFIATANSVVFVGAKPIFADIEEQTFGLNPENLEKNISSKTKAIMPMDYGGTSCKIDSIKEISDNNNLLLLEDAAESLGSKHKGKMVGSISDSAIFSFCGNKVLTTGEGGAITTNSKDVYEKIKLIRSHGRVDVKNYFSNPNVSEYVDVGYNWRMSSITAALGLSQLEKLPYIIKSRQENANYISSRISKNLDLEIPPTSINGSNIFQMYTIKLKNKAIRDSLQEFLINKKIISKIYFQPIHLTSFYMNNYNTYLGQLPITEDISQRILTLPLYPNMTHEEKNYLIDSISEFFEINNA